MPNQGQVDLSLYLSHDALKPENMTEYIKRYAQGLMVVENIFPSVPCADSFTWLEQVDTTGFESSMKIAEGSELQFNVAEFQKKSDTPVRYMEGGAISQDQIRFGYDSVNYLEEVLERIASKLTLQVERDTLAELQDTTQYSTINTQNGSNWSSAASATPIDDILDLSLSIQNDEVLGPTDLILGNTDYYNLIATDQVWQSKMYTKDMVAGTDTFIAKINNLPIAISNAVYYTGGTRTAVLAAQGILLNRACAKKFVVDEFATERDVIKTVTPNKIWVKGTRYLKVKVLKPQLIGILQTLTS
jgi:hypothetical protein